VATGTKLQMDMMSLVASAFGRMGAEARKKALSPKRRQEIARKAAKARHAKAKKGGKA